MLIQHQMYTSVGGLLAALVVAAWVSLGSVGAGWLSFWGISTALTLLLPGLFLVILVFLVCISLYNQGYTINMNYHHQDSMYFTTPFRHVLTHKATYIRFFLLNCATSSFLINQKEIILALRVECLLTQPSLILANSYINI